MDPSRKFLVIREYEKDKTLEPLKAYKFEEWVRGVDVSEGGIQRF